MKFPIFETERLIVRAVTEKDIPIWQRHLSHHDVSVNLATHSLFRSPEAIFSAQGKDQWVWGIFLKSHLEEVIGMIYLLREANPTHRGFWLAKEHWNKGLMSEAVAPIMDYAFNHLGFEKIILGNALGNTRSRRIKEKDGAVFVRIESVSDSYYANPNYKEREIWELTKERWKTGCVKNLNHP